MKEAPRLAVKWIFLKKTISKLKFCLLGKNARSVGPRWQVHKRPMMSRAKAQQEQETIREFYESPSALPLALYVRWRWSASRPPPLNTSCLQPTAA